MKRIINRDQSETFEAGACRKLHVMLSDYVDNLLPARQMWEVEKHLSSCKACSATAQQMKLTVQLLHSAPGFDTGGDFMAKLHARLDGIEAEAMRPPSASARLRDWLAGLQQQLRMRSAPTFGMGMAVAGIAALVLAPQWIEHNSVQKPGPSATVSITSQPVQQEIDRHLADVARDPLGDVAAENLAMNANSGDDNARSEIE